MLLRFIVCKEKSIGKIDLMWIYELAGLLLKDEQQIVLLALVHIMYQMSYVSGANNLSQILLWTFLKKYFISLEWRMIFLQLYYKFLEG